MWKSTDELRLIIYGIRVARGPMIVSAEEEVMVGVLEEIYQSQTVTDGEQTYSALNSAGLPTFMDRKEGELLSRMVERVKPTMSLEVGFAYGISTLFICEALEKLSRPARHIVIDPFQRTKWHCVGLHNIQTAGFSHLIDFVEECSEFALAQLLRDGIQLDFALIDGLHTFEQCMIEFFYIDRMLNVNGILVFDDADWPCINRVIRVALSYGNYVPVDQVGAPGSSRSLIGSLRTFLRRIPHSDELLRRDLLYRSWDLGVAGTCVALQKTANYERGNGWYRDF